MSGVLDIQAAPDDNVGRFSFAIVFTIFSVVDKISFLGDNVIYS